MKTLLLRVISSSGNGFISKARKCVVQIFFAIFFITLAIFSLIWILTDKSIFLIIGCLLGTTVSFVFTVLIGYRRILKLADYVSASNIYVYDDQIEATAFQTKELNLYKIIFGKKFHSPKNVTLKYNQIIGIDDEKNELRIICADKVYSLYGLPDGSPTEIKNAIFKLN